MTQKSAESTSQAEPAGYGEAIRELESLLESMERPDVDVDQLTQAVERAAYLLTFCRGRISRAEVRIEQVLTEMEKDESSPLSE